MGGSRNRLIRELVTALSVVVLSTGPAAGQTYRVTWYTIDGGGVMFASNGTYEVGGTIGQPDAGTLSGPSYTVTGGFWAFAAAPECKPASQPEPEWLALPGTPISQKVRYLSFTAGDAGQPQAIRVTMVNLPLPYNTWNGTKMFVGPPEVFCENAGQVKPPCAPAQPRTEWTGATLQCTAEVRDWSVEGVVYVYHEGIIPGGQYDVQVANGECDLAADASYSDPLEMTQSRWGDLVRNCVTCPCGPPDGSVGIPTDVTAVLDKFKNLAPPTFPCYAPVKVRSDLDWCTPNQRIDISDVTFCLDAFRGVQYPPAAFADCMTTEPPWEPGGECYLPRKVAD